MRQWFNQYNPREQLSLLILAIVVACYMLYFFTWSPIATMQREMVLRNDATMGSLQRVDAMVSEVMRLRDSGETVSRKLNLTSVINRTTSSMGLPVTRLQPNSRGEIQVRMENAAFDDVISWLHAMEYGHGLVVLEVSVTSTSAVGRVNASVRIAQAS